jgi:hypothetical protein
LWAGDKKVMALQKHTLSTQNKRTLRHYIRKYVFHLLRSKIRSKLGSAPVASFLEIILKKMSSIGAPASLTYTITTTVYDNPQNRLQSIPTNQVEPLDQTPVISTLSREDVEALLNTLLEIKQDIRNLKREQDDSPAFNYVPVVLWGITESALAAVPYMIASIVNALLFTAPSPITLPEYIDLCRKAAQIFWIQVFLSIAIVIWIPLEFPFVLAVHLGRKSVQLGNKFKQSTKNLFESFANGVKASMVWLLGGLRFLAHLLAHGLRLGGGVQNRVQTMVQEMVQN